MMIKNFLDKKIFIPVKKNVNGMKIAINPKLWNNKSDTKLPFEPIKFLMTVLSGNIKFGSSGEYVAKEIIKNTDIDIINKPTNSAIRLIQKTAILLTYSFIRITNQICHFVSFYFYC